MDLIKVDLQKEELPVYSFLSVSWGYVADLDCGSDHLRFLGGFRFEIYGLIRVILIHLLSINNFIFHLDSIFE
jgi:hypothetical protein